MVKNNKQKGIVCALCMLKPCVPSSLGRLLGHDFTGAIGRLGEVSGGAVWEVHPRVSVKFRCATLVPPSTK